MAAKATAIFDGDDSRLQGAIRRIGRSLTGVQRRFRAGAGELLTGSMALARTGFVALSATTLAAGTALAYNVKKAYDLGGAISDMSAKTGIAIDQLMILQQAGKDAGIEDLSGSVNKMQRNLADAVADGAGPAAQALGMLGLSARDLATQLPTDQLQQIGAKIAALPSPMLRTAAATALFGKSGAGMLALFADSGALGTAANAVGRQATILRDNAARFDMVSDRLGHAGLKLQGFAIGLAAKVLPLMEAATARLEALDLASQGERFGAGVKTAVDFLAGAFADPSALFGATLQFLRAGLLGAGNLLVATIKFAGNLLGSPSFFARLATGFEGLGKVILGTLLNAFDGPVRFLQDGIEFAFERAKAEGEKLKDFFTPGGSAEGNAARAKEDAYLMAKAQGKIPQDATYGERPFGTARSFAEIQRANAADRPTFGAAGQTAAELIKDGESRLKDAAGLLFDNAIDAFRKTAVEDVFGAGEELARGVRRVADMTKKGGAITNKLVGAPGAPAPPQKFSPIREGYDYQGLTTANRSSAIQSGGLVTGGLAPSGGLSSAGLSAGASSSTPTAAWGQVRRGDAARAKKAAAEAAKDKVREGVDKTNYELEELRREMKKYLGS